MRYNTTTGYLVLTTSNATGVYHMIGGVHEYVMGYNTASANDKSEIADFSTIEDKYYDKYINVGELYQNYNNRI